MRHDRQPRLPEVWQAQVQHMLGEEMMTQFNPTATQSQEGVCPGGRGIPQSRHGSYSWQRVLRGKKGRNRCQRDLGEYQGGPVGH